MNDNCHCLSVKIASLQSLPEEVLWELFDHHFTRRPNNFNREMLISRIAHKMQEIYFDEQRDQQRMQAQARAVAFEALKRERKALAQFFSELLPAMGFTRDAASMRKFNNLWLSGLVSCVEKADGKFELVTEFPHHSLVVIEPFQAELLERGAASIARFRRAGR